MKVFFRKISFHLARNVSALWCVPVLLIAFSGVAHAETEIQRRCRSFDSLGKRLDSGRNGRTASYCIKQLRKTPGLVEFADGLVKARFRENRISREELYRQASAALVDSTSSGPYRLFLESSMKRQDRNFAPAAEGFAGAGSAYIEDHNILSAIICYIEGAKSFIGSRDASGAGGLLDKAGSALESLPHVERLNVEVLSVQAEIANLSDDLTTADSLYHLALSRAEEGKFRRSTAYCLNGIGRLNEKRQNMESASDHYERALREYRALGAIENETIILNNLGQVHTRLKNLDRAVGYLAEARSMAESSQSDWLLGYIYYGLGAVAEIRGEKENARESFSLSFESHRSNNNRWGELGARLRLAHIHVLSGEYGEAVQQYDLCCRAYEEMKSWYGLNWALGGMALAKHRLGDLKGAEEYYRRAFDLKTRMGDRRGAAWCLNSLGMVCDLQGRYREALVNEHEAMRIYREIGDESGEGEVHFSIGSVYFYLGNHEKAMDDFEKARVIAAKTGNTNLMRRIASGIGSVYSVSGRFDLAEEFYREYLESARESGDRNDLVWAYNNLASHYLGAGMYLEARECLAENRKLIPHDEKNNLLAIRSLYLEGKAVVSDDAAIMFLTDAAMLAEKNGLEELRWKCLSDLGDRYRVKGDYTASLRYQGEAIRAVESLRFRAGVDELQRHMLSSAIAPYERMISLILGAQHTGNSILEAFGYMERSRAQILAERLRKAGSGVEAAGNDQEKQEKLGLISRLAYLQKALQDGSMPVSERKVLKRQIDEAEEAFTILRLKMAEQNEARVSELYPRNEDPMTYISTLGPNEHLLSFFLGIDDSYLISVRKGLLKCYILPGRAQLEKKLGFFLSLFEQEAEDPSGSGHAQRLPDQALKAAQRQMYELLLGPANEDITPGEILVIIPDGLLGRLSFAMLRNSAGYLAGEHDIFYTPSLRSLYYLRGQGAFHCAEKSIQYDIISLGCSGQGSGPGPSRVYPFTNVHVLSLPNAEREAAGVAALFDSALVLTGRNATETVFKDSPLGQTNILHIAAHSHIDNEDVTRSFIVLTSEDQAGGPITDGLEDGLLQWREIMSLRLRGTLVTLSACESAGGVALYGEGVAGLTQAFLHAGSRCVLASQTDVPDIYAEKFMTGFYIKLVNGQAPASALRELQLEALEWEEVPGIPGLWASFVLVGDGMMDIGLKRAGND